MSQYIARRLLLALPVLVGVSLLVFVMSRVLPGDAFVARAGTSGITPQQRAQYRKEAGLDRPLVTQYLDWGWHAIRLDFGQSLWNRRSVNGELGRALPITVELTVLAAIMGLVVAMPLGVVSAAMQGSPVDHVARVFGVLGLSIPSYVLGSLTITYLAHWFHWTPPAGGVSFVGHPWAQHAAVPDPVRYPRRRLFGRCGAVDSFQRAGCPARETTFVQPGRRGCGRAWCCCGTCCATR